MKSLRRATDRSEIRARIDRLQPTDQPLWGVMTVAQMTRHVRQAFAMALGEVEVQPAPLGVPGSVAKLLALWMPVRWPRGLRTVPELERGTPAMDAGELDEERVALQGAMVRFLDGRPIRATHPMFGAISQTDWLRWGYLHTDHHLRQFGR